MNKKKIVKELMRRKFKVIAVDVKARMLHGGPYCDKENPRAFNDSETEAQAKFIESIPNNLTDNIHIFKNEDWESLAYQIQRLYYPDTQENRKFIYDIVQNSPVSFKLKLKYWLFKKILYRFFTKLFCQFINFIKPPSPELSNTEPQFFNKPGLVENVNYVPQKSERKWKWVDPIIESEYKEKYEKAHKENVEAE